MKSSLTTYVKLSPHYNVRGNNPIRKITIHHMAGNLSVKTCGDLFANPSRNGSSNYGIDSNGGVGLYVEEQNRAWTSDSRDNDYQAITIEVANDGGAPDWHISDKAIGKLIELCVDICKRHNIPKLLWLNDKNEMDYTKQNVTIHQWFAATACPGPYLHNKIGAICDEVNRILNPEPITGDILYKVQTGAFAVKENAEKQVADLKAAGFDAYISIQDNTPPPLPETPKKTNEEIASEVILGEWGNGNERKLRLEAAGYSYDAVQAIVNTMV